MTRIPGASQFVNAARLANQQGLAASTSSLLDNYGGANSLLNAGKRINRSGIGMSASSRAQLDKFMNNTRGVFSNLLSAGIAADQDALQKQILGLRASLPSSKISEHVDRNADKDSGSSRGSNVDTEA